ncbi:MAG: hypothetical protein RhofKO_13890 [Rhodothermales bacterium]
MAKLNLADFGPDKFLVSNVIEGGFGLSFSLSEVFSIGITYERVSGNRIRSSFVEGEPVIYEGSALTELDRTNSRLFVDDNFSALSLSWIYSFN